MEALRLADDRIGHGTERIAPGVGRPPARPSRCGRCSSRSSRPAIALPIAAVLLVGGFLLSRRGWSRLGEVVAAALYLQQAIDPLDRLLQWIEQAQRGFASFARVLGVGQVPPGAARPGGRAAGRAARGARRAFSYADGRDVLHGIDLEVQPGERLAIVGPSGRRQVHPGPAAGRHRRAARGRGAASAAARSPTSTRPSGAAGSRWSPRSTTSSSARCATTSPSPRRTPPTTRCAPRWPPSAPTGTPTCRTVSTPSSATGPGQLGAAEAQQLALARLVLADPHTLILDEATAALDPTTARRTERALAAVLTGRTVIAIAHRLNTAHDADRVAVMEDGRITETRQPRRPGPRRRRVRRPLALLAQLRGPCSTARAGSPSRPARPISCVGPRGRGRREGR